MLGLVTLSIQCYIPEGLSLLQKYCENLKSFEKVAHDSLMLCGDRIDHQELYESLVQNLLAMNVR